MIYIKRYKVIDCTVNNECVCGGWRLAGVMGKIKFMPMQVRNGPDVMQHDPKLTMCVTLLKVSGVFICVFFSIT